MMEHGVVMQGMGILQSAGRAARTSADHAGLAQALAAYAYGVGIADVRAATRGKSKVALARQVAMYLCHTVFGVGARDVAKTFGRDDSTARHALRQIENMRENEAFDRAIAHLEATLRRTAGGPA